MPKAHIQQFLAHKESMLDLHYLQAYLPALERSMEAVSRFIESDGTIPAKTEARPRAAACQRLPDAPSIRARRLRARGR